MSGARRATYLIERIHQIPPHKLRKLAMAYMADLFTDERVYETFDQVVFLAQMSGLTDALDQIEEKVNEIMQPPDATEQGDNVVSFHRPGDHR